MDPINLDNLREMLNNDKEAEEAILNDFFKLSEECIDKMASNLTEDYNEEFFQSSHALKGMALNLGADKLGNICTDTQSMCIAPISEKEAYLDQMRSELVVVREFLNK